MITHRHIPLTAIEGGFGGLPNFLLLNKSIGYARDLVGARRVVEGKIGRA